MDPAVLNRAPGSHQGLTGHLAAEDPLTLLGRLDTAEDVDLYRLEVQQSYKKIEGLAHRDMLAGRAGPGEP